MIYKYVYIYILFDIMLFDPSYPLQKNKHRPGSGLGVKRDVI